MITKEKSYRETVDMINEKVVSGNILQKSERVVFIAPMPFSDTESANMIQVTEI